jgi:addiction module HigA family antidote
MEKTEMAEYPKRYPNRAPTHPGEILGEAVLPALKMTMKDAAAALGVTRQTLHNVLSGKVGVTPEMALRLGKFCGNGPTLWLGMRQAYDLWHAERAFAKEIAKIPTLKAA